MPIRTCTLKELAYHVKTMKKDGNSTALLIGAGVSVTAGVPLAGEMVKELIEEYSGYDLKQYEGKPNAYNLVMHALSHNQRESFLRNKIQKAKINLAHFFIGSLVSEGYVDCILTTNFDSLLVKTLSLFNIFPSIYDLANTKKFLPNSISSQQNIFFLHGQGTAFRMLNTEEETKESTEYFTRLFDHLDKRHSWIVVGYSGETDFIFKGLAEQAYFNNNLYWVGRKNEPPAHVEKELCCKDSVRYLNSFGADSFFRDLNNELGLSMPSFVDRPFSHVKDILKNIGELKFEQDKQQSLPADFLIQTFLKIDNAISTIEADDKKPLTEKEIQKIEKGNLEQKISELFTLGKYDEIIKKHSKILSSGNEKIKGDLAWAYAMKGGPEIEKGNIKEGNRLFNEAVKLKPDLHIAWYNWGTLLGNYASVNKDEDLFNQAFEKYAMVVKIQPGYHYAWNNWGSHLARYATLKGDDIELLQLASKKYEEATRIDPEFSGAWSNWGINQCKIAIMQKNNEAMFTKAFEKFAKAIKIRHDNTEAWLGWGNGLGSLAVSKGNDENLFKEAFEKYSEVIKIKHDYYEAWNNWGTYLAKFAIAKDRDEKLLNEALEKFNESNKHKENHSSYNIACLYSLLNKKEKALEALKNSLSTKSNKLSRKEIENDNDLKNIKNSPEFIELLNKYLPSPSD